MIEKTVCPFKKDRVPWRSGHSKTVCLRPGKCPKGVWCIEKRKPAMKISDIGDDYNQALRDGSIAKTMKALFKLDKHHLFTPFKMGYYCAVLIERRKSCSSAKTVTKK